MNSKQNLRPTTRQLRLSKLGTGELTMYLWILIKHMHVGGRNLAVFVNGHSAYTIKRLDARLT